MTDFNIWSHENLVKFAQDATAELQFLRDELKRKRSSSTERKGNC